MVYNFKVWQELAWGILIAILVTVAQALVTFDASVINDWQVWAVSIFSSCVRAISAIIIASLSGKLIFNTDPPKVTTT